MIRTSVPLLAVALLATILAAAPRPSAAAWPGDPLVNVPLCATTGEQSHPASVSDGAGGAIVTWRDYRTGVNLDIYAQRVSAAGAVLWTANGVAICTAGNNQYDPAIVSDDAGGAIITWEDWRSGGNIYAQRISAEGTVQWAANGVAICTATGNQEKPAIVADGAGGAIVAWQDYRGGATADLYVQRISAGGVVQWTANGVVLCSAADNQFAPVVASDGAGGAIVAWQDYRGGTADLYGQRISSAGAAQWTADGVAICTATAQQEAPVIIADGASGAIVAWYDARGSSIDVYAQRISAGGAVQWTTDGVLVCGSAGSQLYPTIATDGAGGATIAWYGEYSSNYHVFAQRISAGGTPLWATGGVALCTAYQNQLNPHIVADGAGGAIVAWEDYRGSSFDVYAQRISAGGAVQWTTDGVAICTAAGNWEREVVIVADGGAPGEAGSGAIVSWADYRSGNYDVYAQRITRYGVLSAEPVIASVRDIPNDQGGKFKVPWYSSCLDVAPDFGIASYWIWRSVPPNYAALALSRGARLLGSDETVLQPGEEAITTSLESGQIIFWEYVGSQVADGDAGYSFVMPTTSDSVAASNPYTLVRVQARASSGSAFWNSAPDSGYSVDNLAPTAPAPFTGQYAGGTSTLHWAANPAADLAEYRLYRGGTADFVPAPGNLVVAQPDTGFVDAAGAPYYYKLCAVDVHGNASDFTTLLPSGAVDVPGPALPRAVFLAPPAPNPAWGAATLRFGLPRAARVELALYDQQGRRVRSLLAGEQPAGENTLAWDGRDEGGRALPGGLYFVRLATEGRTLVSRLAVIR